MKTAVAIAAVLIVSIAGAKDDIVSAFRNPPDEAKPWTYWFWCNSLTDRETVVEEAKDIADLGFGGVLLTDSRGYWVDDDHVVNPPASIVWGSDEWLDLMADAIRACSTNNLSFTLNIAASGGHLRGQEDVKGDNPKYLMFRRYRPGDAFERPASPYFRDVAAFAVRTADPLPATEWLPAGDGIVSTAASQSRRTGGTTSEIPALEVRDLKSAADGAGLGADWLIVRFGCDIIPGHPEDVDVLDPAAVRRHLDRVVGKLLQRIPGLFGQSRTLRYLYNVSWEGMMPTWSPTFERDYERIVGRPLRPDLPILAGFALAGRDGESFRRDYRRSRGVMMVENFYATVREWAHERNMGAVSESGGPWPRAPEAFGECDQLRFLSANDIPQGEFWLGAGKFRSADGGRANANGRYIVRGPVYAAAAYGLPIVSAEAFTHMHSHYSVDPSFLKPVGDQAFADGINLMVWHTYTTSPKSRFGTPGNEYFAGSHINRHVTWHDDLAPFIRYLGRCQTLLQRGEPVADIAVLAGDGSYVHWGMKWNGRLRNKVADDIDVRIPHGYDFDMLNDHAVASNPGLLKRYRKVYDARRPEARRGTVVPVDGLLPDVETSADISWRHRRDGATDVYFVTGEGAVEAVFRAQSPAVETWDAVSGVMRRADAAPLADGRTRVRFALPTGGSAFVMFLPQPSPGVEAPVAESAEEVRVEGPWEVSFAYHPWISAPPPAARRMERLVDFTKIDDLRHFAGTAVYRTHLAVKGGRTPKTLNLSPLPSGLARVFVNGIDCGVAWCAPWEVDVSAAIRRGGNEIEIRYVNNWHNRLVGDCALPPEKRVTKSVLHYWRGKRGVKKIYSGPAEDDPLQPSGLLGPVTLN